MGFENKYISSFFRYLTCIGLALYSIHCFGQDDLDLTEFDNRFEGSTTELISGSANLKLLSLITQFEDFEWNKNDTLNIEFYLDDIKPVNILVQQRKGNVIYRMKSKDFPTLKGRNIFDPWPIDDMLSKLELTSEHLAVTVTDSLEQLYYPATVFISKDSIEINKYLFHFLPGRSLTRIKFIMYKGLYKDIEIDASTQIYFRDLRRRTKPGGEPFQLEIDKGEIDITPEWEGWITLQMKAKDNENYSNVEAIFFFYHSPDFNKLD